MQGPTLPPNVATVQVKHICVHVCGCPFHHFPTGRTTPAWNAARAASIRLASISIMQSATSATACMRALVLGRGLRKWPAWQWLPLIPSWVCAPTTRCC